MGLGSAGKSLDGLCLAVFLQDKGLGEVYQEVAGEDDEKGLAYVLADADLKDDRHQIGDEKEQVREV